MAQMHQKWPCINFIFLFLDRRSATWNLTKGTGNPPDVDQDEDSRGAAPRLSEAHRRTEGEPVCQGGALYHAANWRKFCALPG